MKPATEEDIFDLQIGLGESATSVEDKHFFDTAGYLVLEDLLPGSGFTGAGCIGRS